jgi:hypothetical protein
LLSLIGGCAPSSSSSGSGSTGSGANSSSSQGGLGGLLSHEVQPGSGTTHSATLADTASGAPSLTAPAARLLPPMPQARAHHRTQAHPGLIAGWLHDVGSWF